METSHPLRATKSAKLINHNGRTVWVSEACKMAYARWYRIRPPGYDEELIHGDDLPILLWAIRSGEPVCVCVRWWAQHREHCPAGSAWVTVWLSVVPADDQHAMIVAERIILHCGIATNDVMDLPLVKCPISAYLPPPCRAVLTS